MAMALYPEVQKKAQAELDRVLDGRLPEFNDRPNLPYINAVIKESGRWQPVAPLGTYSFTFRI
jgi:cytochrome P450